MCGIFGILQTMTLKQDDMEKLREGFNKIERRGPDFHKYQVVNEKTIMGFHRLAIMDLSEKGNQPFCVEKEEKRIHVVCNGEIYNYKQLKEKYEIEIDTSSDCGIIIPLYEKIGIERLVEELDGEYAFILVEEYKGSDNVKITAVRDKIGVRPLFWACEKIDEENKRYGFASEAKALTDSFSEVKVFPPGNYFIYETNRTVSSLSQYYKYEYETKNYDEKEIRLKIATILENCVKKRLDSDRPIACLLSGGLDSSLIAAIAAKILRERGMVLRTFNIGMKGGTDQYYAELVAKHIGSQHETIELTHDMALDAIKETVYATETFDITTIRASIWQRLISKHISENTDIKVILCGDGSDEVCSGYRYSYQAPSLHDLHTDAVRLVKEIHLYDGLRADRATSYHGLELRVPFLDPEFVDYFLSVDPSLRMPTLSRCEKYLLRSSFSSSSLLPDEVLFRKKEAFSDGVSSLENSWFVILQQYLDSIVSDSDLSNSSYSHCPPPSKEAFYYRSLFSLFFSDNNSSLIPRFWLPQWCGSINEPSARVLSVYST